MIKTMGYPALRYAVAELVNKKAPKYFRIHTAGDFVDQKYLDMWQKIALDNPHTKFMVFTKAAHLKFDFLPSNFIVRVSQWPGWTPCNASSSSEGISKAYMDDGHVSIPDWTFRCPGSCIRCKFCWTHPNEDVVFKKH
jgi:hypothetical protein